MAITTESDERTKVGGLILESLEIENFRAFKHLKVSRLGRVNLITGRNNSGKTCVLEALHIFARRGSPEAVWQVLQNREQLLLTDEVAGDATRYGERNKVIDILRSLFSNSAEYNRFWKDEEFHVGQHQESRPFTFGIQRYSQEEGNNAKAPSKITERNPGFLVGITFDYASDFNRSRYTGFSGVYDARRIIEADYRALFEASDPYPSVLIPSGGVNYAFSSRMFDNIAATELENDMLDMMNLMIPAKRINFRHSGIYPHSPYVLLKSGSEPIPLNQFGDGTRRLLGLGLAILNSRNGFLLIDEFENGLHYTVQVDIWRHLFKLARRYNVQVFATTHSWDCIEAFQQASVEDEDPKSGMLIRLTRQGDEVVSTVFDEEDLRVITRDGIEVR
ncbi:MAG: AAA family ATPase [Armatimonadaceae bacterium]